MKSVAFCLLALVLIVNSSCKKGAGDFTISGTITDSTFSGGLSGATLELYQVPVGTQSMLLVGNVTLGADGKYSFTFPRERMEKYIIKVNKLNYFPIEETIYYSSLDIGKVNTRNYFTKAKAWVELRLVNMNPIAQDHLRYIKQEGLQGCAECCPITNQDFFGALDTSIFCINNGNTPYSIYYLIMNTNNQGTKQVTTVPFDTTQLYLEY